MKSKEGYSKPMPVNVLVVLGANCGVLPERCGRT
jgi:hypothetical protein